MGAKRLNVYSSKRLIPHFAEIKETPPSQGAFLFLIIIQKFDYERCNQSGP